MSRRLHNSVLLFLFLFALAGCRAAGPPSSPEPIRARDDLGREIELNRPPERIISLAPNITEILYELGLGDRVVGVTTYCDHPPEAAQKEKIGDTINPNLERIVSLRPDLVLLSTASQLQSFDTQLRARQIPVYAVDDHSVASVTRAYEQIGRLTGDPILAKTKADRFNEQIRTIEQRTRHLKPIRVLLVIQTEPLMVPGERSFVTEMIRMAGGESITTDAVRDYAQFSVETVIERAPEVIVIPGSAPEPRRLPGYEWAQLSQTPAMKHHRVYALHGDLLMRPGPRLVVGLEDLAAVLHPEAFPESVHGR
ncbi:MAG: cobalamin-binding protein [Acidobacteria bacterium]|nr:cobalamin-binding protein [Acidobacteriota bacterium]